MLASLDHFVSKQLFQFKITPTNYPLKKFVRSYYEITNNLKNSKYIPNFDNYDFQKQKDLLKEIFDIDSSKLTRQEVNSIFRKKIFQSIKDLEKDLLKHS